MNHTVSVIIPVLNAASMLKNVLEALSEQTYPEELIEVIVVDNGSEDNTQDIAHFFGVQVLQETSIKNPYVARNKGLHHASGSIFAFTDANKVPDRQWIEKGVEALDKEQADLAGGHILFDLGEFPTAAEICDAATFNNNRNLVLTQNGSVTGNLFCRRYVVKEVGPMPDLYRSGMDMYWSQKAVQKGFKLIFAEEAIVRCQPRKLTSLLKKSWRVGKFHPFVFRHNGKSTSYILEHTLRTFSPPRIHSLQKKVCQLGENGSLFKIWCVSWMCKLMMGMGRLRGLGFMNRRL